MNQKLSERRLAENQVIFRQDNEQITQGLQALKEAAKSDGHNDLAKDVDVPLHFYCECSDENCKQRIILKPSEYTELHQNRSQFVLMPGHDVARVERVVHKGDKFIVVEKYNAPPPAQGEPNRTDVHNA